MKQIRNSQGFTLIELMIAVVIIAILAGVTVLGYGNWRESTAKNEIQSDLSMAASAMENVKNFGSGYPSSIPSTFKGSPNVTVTYVSGGLQSYCINGTSTIISGISYHVDSANGKKPVPGECVGSINGLIGLWDMNGGSQDKTSYGNNGVISGGVSLTTDKNGQSSKAYSFDGGGGSYIAAPSNSTAPPTSQITLSVWAMRTGDGSNPPRAIVMSRYATYIDVCFNGQILFSLGLTTTQALITGGTCAANDGSWHLYTVTYNGAQAQLYIDGVLAGSGDYTGAITDHSYVDVGRFNGGGYTFKGSADDARMYNRALSASEVQALYANGPR